MAGDKLLQKFLLKPKTSNILKQRFQFLIHENYDLPCYL